MSKKAEIHLRDGTLVRHKSSGYEGKIEGTTAIKACFTRAGVRLDAPISKEEFQYRVAISGKSMRQIAPGEDLEILAATAEIICICCQKSFNTRPGLAGKASGRCACGGWICPVCLSCQTEEAARNKATSCANQRKRFLKKSAREKT